MAGGIAKINQNSSKSAICCTIIWVLSDFYYICIEKSNKMHYMELVEVIKQRREVLKVTQEYLAEISGVSLRTLKQFESGKGNPTLFTLQKLADALGLELCLKSKNIS